MEGSRKGGRLVTYSRHKRRLQADDTQAIKRRRVVPDAPSSDGWNETVEEVGECALPSSPTLDTLLSEPAIFSDENAPPSTPPSSPPCSSPKWPDSKVESTSSHPYAAPGLPTKNAPATSRQITSKAKENQLRKALVQMQLNLGQTFQKRCRTCGMEYVPSNPEDLELHRKYHSQTVDGVTMSKDFLKKAEGWRGIEWTGRDGRDRIASISRRAQCRAGRSHVLPVLRVVQRELGAVDIPDNLLWSLCNTELSAAGGGTDTACLSEAEGRLCESSYERYKVYLYIHDTKCVGLCLVERVAKAFKVLRADNAADPATGPVIQNETTAQLDRRSLATGMPDETGEDKSISVGELTYDNWMGISRIWVSSSFRKKGVASALLDTARRTFRDGVVTPKHLVAFSQPTASGARLARHWFGAASGWHVYADSNTVMQFKHGEWYSQRADEVVL